MTSEGHIKVDRMSARTSSDAQMPLMPHLHRCSGNNGTCAEQLSLFPPFSSATALLVLVAVLVGVVLVSLATFHFHKRKLRNRKIQRAQEEYERDSRNAAAAAAASSAAHPNGPRTTSGGDLAASRPCVIVRPPVTVRLCEEECESGAVRAAAAAEAAEAAALNETVVAVDC